MSHSVVFDLGLHCLLKPEYFRYILSYNIFTCSHINYQDFLAKFRRHQIDFFLFSFGWDKLHEMANPRSWRNNKRAMMAL